MMRQVSASILAAILTVSIVSAIGIVSIPVQNAAAQTVTIKTSADSHDGTFFGEGALQVIITNPDADDDSVQETLTVDIDASPDQGGTDASDTFTIPETSKSSGRFEFYLVHNDSRFAPDGTGIDPVNTNGIDSYVNVEAGLGGDNDPAPVITFGTGATELNTGTDLLDADGESDVQFDITAEDEDITVNYEEQFADLTLDRDTFGSTSVIHVFITDQDANLNPTEPDTFTIPDADVPDLFDVDGGAFDGDLDFDETGDNTAIFEAIVQLVATGTAAENEFEIADDAVQLTQNDMADYEDISDAANDVEQATSDTNFEIDDSDGEIDQTGDVTFGTELKVTVRDNDQNKDSDKEDSILGGLIVSTEDGDDEVTVNLKETGKNTGVFEPDVSNNEIKITFGGAQLADQELQLTQPEVTDDIIISYLDPLNDDSTDETFEQSITLAIQNGAISLPESAGINDDFTATITDMDLNNNPRTKDTYTVTLDGDEPVPFMRGATDLGDFAQLEVEVEGDNPDFDGSVTETFVETGINTGIFEATFDMADLLESAGADNIDDGDSIVFTYHDLFDDVSREASDELSIGRANTGVDFSRTALPVPPTGDSDYVDVTGNTEVFTTLTITDADQNKNSGTEESIDFLFELDAAADEPSFRVTLDGDGVDEEIVCLDEALSADPDCTDDNDYVGSDLEDITDGALDGLTLTETGKATGVFDDELTFVHGDLDEDNWQDLELTITYLEAGDDPDEEESGITFRGNDGSISVDQDSAKAGTLLTITVQDEDLNLDDDTVEEFPSSTTDDDTFIVMLETEDDEIDNLPSTEQFRETGPDTGIFEAQFLVGTDIEVTQDDGEEITQATNILITYNDEVDSTGGSGDEIEVNVPVVSATGAISVTPELVGPGTEINVLITDTDLDKDPHSTENYDATDPDSDDFFVSFRSDRNEVHEASPDLEETGPNTGVFSFTIELVTDESACEDDDLGDDSKFEASGGSEPSIGACPGDLISIRYEDEQDASGHSTTVSQVVEVKSFDPTFVADKDSYNIGDRVTISISDPDANRDPDIADSLTDIRVSSDSDQVGQELSALETGKSTGVFKLSFVTSSGTQGGAVSVKQGDDVTVEYTDAFPADFEEDEDDKDFTFSVPIQGIVGTGTTTPTPPSVKDVTGNTLDEVSAGQQVVLSTTIVNNNAQSQPFVGIVEVRDSSGITVFLAWQTGTLNPSGQTEVGLSWTPDNAGEYTVRTFVISNLSNPQILSLVKESTITVS
jgi:hypothetical protein